MPKKSPPVHELELSLMSRVIACPTTGCWLWTGSDSGTTGRGKGYGKVGWRAIIWYAHILMYCVVTGDWATYGWQIDHKCKNRRCIRPDHLEKVTHTENQRRK